MCTICANQIKTKKSNNCRSGKCKVKLQDRRYKCDYVIRKLCRIPVQISLLIRVTSSTDSLSNMIFANLLVQIERQPFKLNVFHILTEFDWQWKIDANQNQCEQWHLMKLSQKSTIKFETQIKCGCITVQICQIASKWWDKATMPLFLHIRFVWLNSCRQSYRRFTFVNYLNEQMYVSYRQ